jgi:glucokinase
MYLGIEIGGTKLQIGLGAGTGVLAGLWRGTVGIAAGPEGIRRQIASAVLELLARADVDRARLKGVGIGFGGPVDDATKTVLKSHQIPGWDHYPLAVWIGNLVRLPAVLGNDADVAGLAEAHFGAGKGISPVFYITLGSGIGGGFVQDGVIYRGTGRGAAEFGHLRIWDPTPQDGSESRPRPLEDIASGWAIGCAARFQVERVQDGAADLLALAGGRPERVTADTVRQAAERANPLALTLLEHAWSCLAEGICQVLALLCPRRIIIGGGVSFMGERLLFEPLRKRVAQRVFPPFAACYEIVPAALGEEVVVHGALALARQRFP